MNRDYTIQRPNLIELYLIRCLRVLNIHTSLLVMDIGYNRGIFLISYLNKQSPALAPPHINHARELMCAACLLIMMTCFLCIMAASGAAACLLNYALQLIVA